MPMISVNLTTTSERLGLCRIALISLLMQSRLPDQINLWVSRESYLSDKGIANDETINQLFISLPETNRHLLRIRWTPNTGPYRKLIPALRESTHEDIIVTADDDILYGELWLESLMLEYAKNPDRVAACRVRKKRCGLIGIKTSYVLWSLVSERTVLATDYIITFGGGAVLSKAMFREHDIYDDSFIEIAPTSDDLWYTKLLTLSGKEVQTAPCAMDELTFMIHHHGLEHTNRNVLAKTFWGRLIKRIWIVFYGFLGGAVCGNDHSYRNINRYFSKQ